MAARFRNMLVLVLVLLITSVGVAWASIPAPDGTVNGCYKNAGNHDLIVIDSTASCPGGYTALNWNQPQPVETQVVSDTASGTASNGAAVNVQKACPVGTFATGGGGDPQESNPHDWYLQLSEPLLNTGVPVGWKVTFRYLGAGTPNYSLAVFAICTAP